MDVITKASEALRPLLSVVEVVQALIWLAITWQQWLPRYWISWPRAEDMRDGMAVASMFAAAFAASVVHAVATVRSPWQRRLFLGLTAIGTGASIWAWGSYELVFAELQDDLGPIGSISWAQGKVRLAQRYAVLVGFVTLSVMAFLRFIVSDPESSDCSDA